MPPLASLPVSARVHGPGEDTQGSGECTPDFDDGNALNQKGKKKNVGPAAEYVPGLTRHSAYGFPSWRARRAHHIVILGHMVCDGVWDRQIWTPLVPDAAKLAPDLTQRCAGGMIQ